MKLSNRHEFFLDEMQTLIAEQYIGFCGYQERMLQTLSDFHETCVRNGIPYYLTYGSLLGAIRDGGQIPWDYDIDLWVPYEYSGKLMDALDRDMCDEYHYVTRFRDSDYRTYTLKIAPKDLDCEVLHLDIFWLTGAYDSVVENVRMNKLKKKHYDISMYKYCPKKYLGVSGRVSEAFYKINKIKACLYSSAHLERMFRKIMGKPCQGAKYWTDNALFDVIDSVWIGTPKLMKVDNGLELYVPENPEKVLEAVYGDYMSVFSVQDRMNEFLQAYQRISKLGKLSS